MLGSFIHVIICSRSQIVKGVVTNRSFFEIRFKFNEINRCYVHKSWKSITHTTKIREMSLYNDEGEGAGGVCVCVCGGGGVVLNVICL